jgi:type IX secretion system PorP/SprF family membrane protein
MNDGAILSLGLNLSLLMMQERLIGGNNPNDPMFGTAMKTQLGLNAGIGAYYFKKNFFAGFSIPQLLTNDFSTGTAEPELENSLAFGRLQYYLIGGYRLDAGDKWSFTPTALLELSQKTTFGYELMLTGIYNRLIEAGIGFAAHSCLRAAAGVNIKNISLRYQFSQNLGNDYSYFGGSHFISLWIKF